MIIESILLIGRNTRNVHEVLETYAEQLSRHAVVDDVEIYENEPIRELRRQFKQLSADSVYAVPRCVAHTHDTINDVPAALSYVVRNVHYCERLGQNPAVTEVIKERRSDLSPISYNVYFILLNFEYTSKPYSRQITDYHAVRLREQSGYGEVLTCYRLQNPDVECVRHNVTKERTIAIPLFLMRTEATEDRIPEELDLARGGIEYAYSFQVYPQITDAVQAEVEKQRTLPFNNISPATSFEGQLTRTQHPVTSNEAGVQR